MERSLEGAIAVGSRNISSVEQKFRAYGGTSGGRDSSGAATHSNSQLPNVILGGTGGYFDTGRWLQMPRTNPTQVLISLANAMGVDVSSFGEQGLMATSPLSGLTA
jgi:hypothetical protein